MDPFSIIALEAHYDHLPHMGYCYRVLDKRTFTSDLCYIEVQISQPTSMRGLTFAGCWYIGETCLQPEYEKGTPPPIFFSRVAWLRVERKNRTKIQALEASQKVLFEAPWTVPVHSWTVLGREGVAGRERSGSGTIVLAYRTLFLRISAVLEQFSRVWKL